MSDFNKGASAQYEAVVHVSAAHGLAKECLDRLRDLINAGIIRMDLVAVNGTYAVVRVASGEYENACGFEVVAKPYRPEESEQFKAIHNLDHVHEALKRHAIADLNACGSHTFFKDDTLTTHMFNNCKHCYLCRAIARWEAL